MRATGSTAKDGRSTSRGRATAAWTGRGRNLQLVFENKGGSTETQRQIFGLVEVGFSVEQCQGPVLGLNETARAKVTMWSATIDLTRMSERNRPEEQEENGLHREVTCTKCSWATTS